LGLPFQKQRNKNFCPNSFAKKEDVLNHTSFSLEAGACPKAAVN
jgi:hypothetical protein